VTSLRQRVLDELQRRNYSSETTRGSEEGLRLDAFHGWAINRIPNRSLVPSHDSRTTVHGSPFSGPWATLVGALHDGESRSGPFGIAV
jgi:hypothetical protein